jgi:hypothetical protein
MKIMQFNVDLDDVDPNGVFEDQTGTGAGDMTLNGAGVVDGEWITPDGFAKQVGFESAGNIASVTFTVAGFADEDRHFALSETVTGVNANTVETTNYFYVITGITRSATIGTNVEAGPVDEATTEIIPMNWRANNVSLLAEVTGTVNYTLQQTFDDVHNTATPTWASVNSTDFVGATATKTGTLTTIPFATRLLINSYSSGAAVKLSISHSDI